MREPENRTQLPLATSGCCSPHAAGNSHKAGGPHAASTFSKAGSPGKAAEGAEFGLEGLTCGHCAQTVEKAVTGVEGVEAASIELVPGGRSRLVIAGTPEDAAIRDAVTAAGYTLVSH